MDVYNSMDGYNSSEGSFAGALPGVSHMQNGILPSMSLGTGEPGPAEMTQLRQASVFRDTTQTLQKRAK